LLVSWITKVYIHVMLFCLLVIRCMVIDEKQFQIGVYYLQQWLKKVRIKVTGNVVEMVQVYELPDEDSAKLFAKGLKDMWGGEGG